MEDNYNIAQGSHNVRELNVMNFAFSGNAYDQLLARNRGLTQAFLSVSAGDVYFTNLRIRQD
jgi:hypothetical protein